MCLGTKHIHDKRVLHRDLKSKVRITLCLVTHTMLTSYLKKSDYLTRITGMSTMLINIWKKKKKIFVCLNKVVWCNRWQKLGFV